MLRSLVRIQSARLEIKTARRTGLRRDKNFGCWRDTHVRLVGPVVLPIQIVFLQDWYWATEPLLEVSLDPELSPEGDIDVLSLPSAPVDEIQACTLFF